MDKPGAICKESRKFFLFFFFFVITVCIIKLVSLGIGLGWKDDLIRGASTLLEKSCFQYPSILTGHGTGGASVRASWQMVTVKW